MEVLTHLLTINVNQIAYLLNLIFKFIPKRCFIKELSWNCLQSFLGPVREPVNCATIYKWWKLSNSFLESASSRAHAKNHMQVLFNLLCKEIHKVLLACGIVKVCSTFVSCVNATRLANLILVIPIKDIWYFILIDEIVYIFKHITILHICIS